MKTECIGIYGETCTGKSTIGKSLSLALNCCYISFGDLKRDEIALKTELGTTIKKALLGENLIPAELGYSMFRKAIGHGLNIISGYPISADEFSLFSNSCTMAGVIILSADEQTLLNRFRIRRECPYCHEPGIEGGVCYIHGVKMTHRLDTNMEELSARRKLYKQRIHPFLETLSAIGIGQLRIDTSGLTRKEVFYKTKQWLTQLLLKMGE